MSPGVARPPCWASCPVSPSLTHLHGAAGALPPKHTRPCRPVTLPSVPSTFPGLALALQHHTGRSLLESSQWSFLSLGAPSWPHPLARSVLCAWGALSFLIEVTNSPYPSSVGSASPGGKHRLPACARTLRFSAGVQCWGSQGARRALAFPSGISCDLRKLGCCIFQAVAQVWTEIPR